MRVGLFGGSFDPIHRGHLEPVCQAARQRQLDQVIYLPTSDPPHKPERQGASAFARFVMVELALLDQPERVVSTHELTPGKAAYTIDTVTHFRQQRPEDDFFLLIGADSFAHFYQWRRWWEIAGAIELIVMVRPGWSAAQLPEEAPAQLYRLLEGERVHLVENEPLDVSSSSLREQLARGERPPEGTIPEIVVRYIEKYSLYR